MTTSAEERSGWYVRMREPRVALVYILMTNHHSSRSGFQIVTIIVHSSTRSARHSGHHVLPLTSHNRPVCGERSTHCWGEVGHQSPTLMLQNFISFWRQRSTMYASQQSTQIHRPLCQPLLVVNSVFSLSLRRLCGEICESAARQTMSN